MRKIDRTGETNINKQGLKMTIIVYRKNEDIDVQFEDGTIIEHKQYSHFKRGEINHPNYNKRTGETNINKQGLKMTIILYRNATDIDVQFEDGTIVKHKTYSVFKKGFISNPNYNHSLLKDRTGETNINNRGLKITIIKYNNARNITVQFEDGTIIEHRSYDEFKRGEINHPNYNKRTGETKINKQGLKMTIIEYNGANDIIIQFEDGIILEHKQYSQFKRGNIKHPFPYQLPNSNITIQKIAYIYKGQVNYLYKCNICGTKEIDTLENINNHKCIILKEVS